MTNRVFDITWYKTPEEVDAAYWQPTYDDKEELYDSEFQCVDDQGNEIELTYEQCIEGIKAQGCWGWVDTEKKVIHAWADESTDPAVVIHMLAHEVGHITGTPCEDHVEEELRAEQFGEVAAEAYRLFMKKLSVSRS